ncbi:hypothetical protein L7F22_050015 [Adiantum nelumboides]|nr:hypothetical protein [Adiantum nelumboides]
MCVQGDDKELPLLHHLVEGDPQALIPLVTLKRVTKREKRSTKRRSHPALHLPKAHLIWGVLPLQMLVQRNHTNIAAIDAHMQPGRGHPLSKSSRKEVKASPSSPLMELLVISTRCLASYNNSTLLLEIKTSRSHPNSGILPCISKNQPVNGGQAYAQREKLQRPGKHAELLTAWRSLKLEEGENIRRSAILAFEKKKTSNTFSGMLQIVVLLSATITTGDVEADSYVNSSLIFRLGKASKFEEMEEVAAFAIKIGKASAVTFTSLMSAYRRVNNLEGAVQTWQSMLKHGIQPSPSAFTVMIDVYGRMKMYEEAAGVYYQLVHLSVGPTIKTCSVLINHLVEAEKQDAALDTFKNLTKVKLRPNRVTYAYLIMGYAKAGNMNGVLKLIEDFKEYGHSPYDLGESFRSTLSYLVKREPLEEVSSPDMSLQADSDEEDKDNDDVDEENLILLHSRDHDKKSIMSVLAFIGCLTVWTSATGKALDRVEVQWDCHLVSDVLHRVKQVDSAWKFHRWVAKKPGYCHDRYTCGKMLRLLLRRQQFTRARHLLREAKENNMNIPIKYLNFLKHCGLGKQANFAIEVFEKLKVSGLDLDESFYKSYLHTLHKCGQHWRAASVCAEMRKAGFSLDKTMYSLLITGFIRAGKLNIAKQLSEQMRAAGFCPDVLMLSYLFRVFHERGKLKKAKRVFKGMQQCGMRLSFHIYESMTQILSSMGRQDEADMLKGECEALISRGSRNKTDRQEWLLYYHSELMARFPGCRMKDLIINDTLPDNSS